MPHFMNGEEAYVGDGVVGTGNNIKPAPGALPTTLIGRLISITPHSSLCNCQVVAIEVSTAQTIGDERPLQDVVNEWFVTTDAQGKKVRVRIVHDYSDCGQFAPIDSVMASAKSRGVRQICEGLKPVEQRHLDAYEKGMNAVIDGITDDIRQRARYIADDRLRTLRPLTEPPGHDRPQFA